MDLKAIIKKFVNELHKTLEDGQVRFNDLDYEVLVYEYLEKIFKFLDKSKSLYAEGIIALNDEQREEFNQIVGKATHNDDILYEMYNESYNLYRLQQQGVIDYPEVEPQKEKAYSVLEEFKSRLSEYLKGFTIDAVIDERDHLENYLTDVVNLIKKFDDGEMISDIENISFFHEMLELLDISEEEKIALIEYILYKNVELYKEKLKNKNSDSLEETLDDEDEIVISSSDEERLDELLEDMELRTKLISITDLEYSDIASCDEVDDDILTNLIGIIGELLKRMVFYLKITPEDAIRKYLIDMDIYGKESREKLTSLLSYMESDPLIDDEVDALLVKAREFVSENQHLIDDMSLSDREVQDNYIKELYQDMEARLALYKNKAYTDIDMVKQDAAYEVSYFISLIDRLNASNPDDLVLIEKACKRIDDVFRILEVTLEDTKKDFFATPDESDERKLFFLMKDKDKSFFEDDIDFDSKHGGISEDYYSKIYESLVRIKDNGTCLSSSINSLWKNLNDFGVKREYNGRTIIFYLVVNGSDIVILDAFDAKKGSTYGSEDSRMELNKDMIKDYIKNLDNPEARSIYLEESDAVYERLKEKLLCENNDLDGMLNDMFIDNTMDINEIISIKR